MVSIVLVSHSKELAAAVKALADQQTQNRTPIATAAGIDDAQQPFGTDPLEIVEAIRSVWSADGVLVLMDLGSAVMSATVAMDLLEPGQAAVVQLVAAPFVEGAMAAAVQASIGNRLDEVAAAASGALGAKQSALGEIAFSTSRVDAAPAGAVQGTVVLTGDADEAAAEAVVANRAGLHFGPAVRFVQMAAQYHAAIQVANMTTRSGPADGRNFNQLLGLGVEPEHRILIVARGDDAPAALAALVDLVHTNFREPEVASGAPTGIAVLGGDGVARLQGLAASPGYAIGAVRLIQSGGDPLRSEDTELATNPDQQWHLLNVAITTAQSQLSLLSREVAATLDQESGMIFEGHRLLLDDERLQSDLRTVVYAEQVSAAEAIRRAVRNSARRFRLMAGEVFQQRAADVEDVGRRLLRILAGEHETRIQLVEPVILISDDLTPSQTAMLDRKNVLAFCTAAGGPAAHTAILARSMGVPAVVGVGAQLLSDVKTGDTVALDGYRGSVIVGPDDATTEIYAKAQRHQQRQRRDERQAAQVMTRTADGKRVEVFANLVSTEDTQLALDNGAEGIGLLRTEFLFQDRLTPPSETEQSRLYTDVLRAFGQRKVLIRTLDIGGDKPAPYLPLPAENSPFLGWRAIRISLAMPEFFKTQMRALLRAAMYGNLHIMLPMITRVSEVEQARALMMAAAEELDESSTTHRANVPLGIMVEVPAAVQILDPLAPHVDFFSLGTNDLAQYTFAADRTNRRVAPLADTLHPAILRQIDQVVRMAHAAGKWVGICGEMAGHPDAVPLLLGLGIDEFSVAPAGIPQVKKAIGGLTTPACRQLAQQALTLPDAESVRKLVRLWKE